MKHFNELTQANVFPLLPTQSQSVTQSASYSVSQLFSFTIFWLVGAKSMMGCNDCVLPVLVSRRDQEEPKHKRDPARQQRFNKYSAVAKKFAAAIYAFK